MQTNRSDVLRNIKPAQKSSTFCKSNVGRRHTWINVMQKRQKKKEIHQTLKVNEER